MVFLDKGLRLEHSSIQDIFWIFPNRQLLILKLDNEGPKWQHYRKMQETCTTKTKLIKLNVKVIQIVSIAATLCSGYHYYTTSFNKTWTQILRTAQVQILLAACQRFEMVAISDDDLDWKWGWTPFVSQPYHKSNLSSSSSSSSSPSKLCICDNIKGILLLRSEIHSNRIEIF